MNNPRITGKTAIDDSKVIEIATDAEPSLISLHDYIADKKTALAQMACDGVPGLALGNKLDAAIASIKHWPEDDIITELGWRGDTYTLPSGNVVGAKEGRHYRVLSKLRQPGLQPKGKLKVWSEQVARPICRWPIGNFALSAMFVPPLLELMGERQTICFDLIGPVDIGKSTLQLLAASVVGPPREFCGSHFLTHAEAAADLHDVLKKVRGMPLLLDNVESIAALPQAKRSEAINALMFDSAHRQQPAIILSSGNVELWRMAKSSGPAKSWLSIPVNGPVGVVGDRWTSDSDPWPLMGGLLEVARDHHGVAYERFVNRLVKEHSEDPEKLRDGLHRLSSRFIERSGVARTNGAEYRHARACGIVYAARTLARRYGALPKPKNRQTQNHIISVYEQFVSNGPAPPDNRTVEDRLSEALKDARCLRTEQCHNIGKGKLAKRVRKAVCLTHIGKTGPELLISAENAASIFRDWSTFLDQLKRCDLIKKDGRQFTVKRKVAGVDLGRVHVIQLPDAVADNEQQEAE